MGTQGDVLPITGVFEVEEGKVVSWREYFDMAALARTMQSLGIDFPQSQ